MWIYSYSLIKIKYVCNKLISVFSHFTCSTQVVEMPLYLFLFPHSFNIFSFLDTLLSPPSSQFLSLISFLPAFPLILLSKVFSVVFRSCIRSFSLSLFFSLFYSPITVFVVYLIYVYFLFRYRIFFPFLSYSFVWATSQPAKLVSP